VLQDFAKTDFIKITPVRQPRDDAIKVWRFDLPGGHSVSIEAANATAAQAKTIAWAKSLPAPSTPAASVEERLAALEAAAVPKKPRAARAWS
jgi:hypothetical protein